MEKRHSNLIISILIIVIILSTSILIFSPNLIYLTYNLFLAMIPFFMSIFMLKKDLNIFIKILLGFLWILFFPNALYVFTDIIHLSNLKFYSVGGYEVSYNMDFMPWFRLVVTFASSLLGAAFSYASFQNVIKSFNIAKDGVNYYLLLTLTSILSGLAIYIGRFIRLNSWDALLQLNVLLTEIKNAILSNKVFFIIMFGILQFLVISIFDIIYRRR